MIVTVSFPFPMIFVRFSRAPPATLSFRVFTAPLSDQADPWDPWEPDELPEDVPWEVPEEDPEDVPEEDP